MKQIFSIFSFTLLLIIGMSGIAQAKVELKDIKGHWAEQDIKQMVDLGIINGYEDGTFKPNNPVTVAEFIKLILFAYSEENYWGEREWKREIVNQTQGRYQMRLNSTFFNGLPGENYWAQPYIDTAINLELIPERNQWERNYNVGLKRSELALIANNLLKYTEDSNHHSYLNLVKHQIKDLDRIPIESEKTAVLDMYVKGVMQGYESGFFGVDRVVTRAEALTIINRKLDKTQRKPNTPDFSIYPHAYVPAYYGSIPVVFPNQKSKQVYEKTKNASIKTNGAVETTYTSFQFFRDKNTKEEYRRFFDGFALGEVPKADAAIGINLNTEHYFLGLSTDNKIYTIHYEPIKAFINALFEKDAEIAEEEILSVRDAVASKQMKEQREVRIGNYKLFFMFDDRTYSSISVGISLAY